MICQEIEKSYLPRELKTDADWQEWQAENLAAAILMPLEPFRELCKYYFRMLGMERHYLYDDISDLLTKNYLVQNMSNVFTVSNRAAELRMTQLNILRSKRKTQLRQ